MSIFSPAFTMININVLSFRISKRRKFRNLFLKKTAWKSNRQQPKAPGLEGSAGNLIEMGGLLSRDNECVYYATRIISRDAPHFQLIGKIDSFIFHKDRAHIFVNGVRFEEADVHSFEPLRYGYAKDCGKVYMMGPVSFKTIKDADPGSFQVINQYCSLDQKHVYWRGVLLTDCEPSTYEALNIKQTPGRETGAA